MKWAAAGFSFFIFAVILLADTGRLAGQLEWMHSLPMGDKIGHFLLVGMLAFLIAASLIHELPHKKPGRMALIVTLTLAVVFGVEEASQAFIRGRNSSIADLAANYAGIAVFSWLASRIRRKDREGPTGIRAGD